MREQAPQLQSFARDVADAGFQQVVLLGMGGSSLGPEVLRQSFGSAAGYPQLVVLDSTFPAWVQAVTDSIDPARTLFLVSSKSGSTIEPNTLYAHFRGLVDASVGIEQAGQHFIAVTDPGTVLAKLAVEAGFRRAFLNPQDIGGRYSVLSLFGLVPAALIGLDLDLLLDRADVMRERCRATEDNPGAWLTTTARRKLIDRLRREQTGAGKYLELAHDQALLADESDMFDDFDETSFKDDRLRLIFTCCHPALSLEAQIALTLRTLGGLTTREIARAFLVPEPTLAQRLVRKVCPHCGTMAEATATESMAYEQELQEGAGEFLIGQGCNFCGDIGLLGRTGVFEVMAISEGIRKLIAANASGQEIRDVATREGMVPLRRAGMLKAKAGAITIGEVLKRAFFIG